MQNLNDAGHSRATRLGWVCLLGLGLLAGCTKPAEEVTPTKAANVPAATQPAQPGANAEHPLVRPVFENDRARVIEVAWDPKATTPAAHIDGADTIGVVGVVLKGGTVEATNAKGKKTREERKTGEILWQPANSNTDARQNVGDSRMNVIQVRLKKVPTTKQYTGPAGSAKAIFQNNYVAAFDYALPPGGKLPPHKYGPRVWVVLEGGDLRSTDAAGKAQMGSFGTSQIAWLPAQEQAIENIGKAPVHIISVELK